MTPEPLTAAFGLGLMVLGGVFFTWAYRAVAPPGDRSRRGRRMLGASLVVTLGAGVVGWASIDGFTRPLLFLNVSAILLVLVIFLVVLAMSDYRAVVHAERHRTLSLLTEELYGFPLKDVQGPEAERIGREALKKLSEARRRDERGGSS